MAPAHPRPAGAGATSGLFRPGEDAGPAAVADEIARIIALPHGLKPFRSVVGYTHSGAGIVTEAAGTAARPSSAGWDSATSSAQPAS